MGMEGVKADILNETGCFYMEHDCGVFGTIWVWLQILVVSAGSSRAMNRKQMGECWVMQGERELRGLKWHFHSSVLAWNTESEKEKAEMRNDKENSWLTLKLQFVHCVSYITGALG